jgi:uncharacterized membrane-anchored protein YhcB (DUF1043 family)
MLNFGLGVIAGVILTILLIRFTLGRTHHPPVKKTEEEIE